MQGIADIPSRRLTNANILFFLSVCLHLCAHTHTRTVFMMNYSGINCRDHTSSFYCFHADVLRSTTFSSISYNGQNQKTTLTQHCNLQASSRSHFLVSERAFMVLPPPGAHPAQAMPSVSHLPGLPSSDRFRSLPLSLLTPTRLKRTGRGHDGGAACHTCLIHSLLSMPPTWPRLFSLHLFAGTIIPPL